MSQSATTTTLTLSAPTVSYGDEETVQARVAVSAADSVAPTGTVTLSSGGVALVQDHPVGGERVRVLASLGRRVRAGQLPTLGRVQRHRRRRHLDLRRANPHRDAGGLDDQPGAFRAVESGTSEPRNPSGFPWSCRRSTAERPAAPSPSLLAPRPCARSPSPPPPTSASRGPCLLSATALAALPGASFTARYAGSDDFAASTSAAAFLDDLPDHDEHGPVAVSRNPGVRPGAGRAGDDRRRF